MKHIRCISKYLAAMTVILSPAAHSAASAQDVPAECSSLKDSVSKAVSETSSLSPLLASPNLSPEDYLSQLYEGVKILAASGEKFFEAAESYETPCRTRLKQLGRIEDMRPLYDLYLEPSQIAYRFFRRAREAAATLNRQEDVDSFAAILTEYDAAVMKLADVCRNDLKDTPAAPTCDDLALKLTQALQ